jgi:hypothetical protein
LLDGAIETTFKDKTLCLVSMDLIWCCNMPTNLHDMPLLLCILTPSTASASVISDSITPVIVLFHALMHGNLVSARYFVA